MPCTELDSTADKAVRVRGKTVEQLFENAVSCMFYTMAEPKWKFGGVLPAVIANFEVYAPDIESLLVSFLEEVLYQHEQLGLYPYQFMIAVTEIADESEHEMVLTAHIAFADCAEPHGSQIKAATYHDIDVRELSEGGYAANLTFDV